MKENTVTLNHGDKVILNSRKGMVGTVRGYALEYKEDPDEAVKNELRKQATVRGYRFDMCWINQMATCLYGDRSEYDRQKKIWSTAINLTDGQEVLIEGQVLKVHYKGNYSDMADFTSCHQVSRC
jgi:hypothetical protein